MALIRNIRTSNLMDACHCRVPNLNVKPQQQGRGTCMEDRSNAIPTRTQLPGPIVIALAFMDQGHIAKCCCHVHNLAIDLKRAKTFHQKSCLLVTAQQ